MFDQAEGPDIERLVTELVFAPHLYADMDRLAPHVAPEVFRYLNEGARAEGRLSAFVTEKLKVPPLAPDDAKALTEGPARVWLLPGGVLQALARCAGIALHAATIGTVIDRNTVQRIKQALSDDEYDFAINRAPLLTRRTAATPIDFAKADDVSAALDEAGWRFIKRTLDGVPGPVIERLAFKLPAAAPWDDFSPSDADVTPDQVLVLVRKLLREVAPQWAALFA